ncbi:glycosyl hydrolase family 28-related protein [Bacillus sp. 4A_MP2]
MCKKEGFSLGDVNKSDLKKPVVNVIDFGVIADGKTDCTAKLNECLEWTKAQGYSHVWLPSGTYLIDAVYRGINFFLFVMPAYECQVIFVLRWHQMPLSK